MNKSKIISFFVASLWSIGAAQAAVDISPTPLQTGSAVDPNILFLLDDSGSMNWGFMPDNLVSRLVVDGYERWVGYCDSIGNYAGVDNTCFYKIDNRAYLASSDVNKIYFDPDVTYTPPVKEDGSLFPQASFTNAKVDGYASSSATVSLKTNYRAIMDNYYYLGASGGYWRYGFTISPSANAGKAFYYQLKSSCSNIYSSSCYDLKYVSDTQQDNFANWFSYYRTRMMAAKAGIGKAFQLQTSSIRVGYAGINTASDDGTIKNSSGKSSQVKKFEGSARAGFFNWLYKKQPDGSTPLIGALTAAGEYYRTAQPWYASDTEAVELTCRQSFTLLMTDGYYDDSTSAVANADNVDGPNIAKPDGSVTKFLATHPFKDNHSNTLADVAMKYWHTDLRPSLENRVPSSEDYPAFWQHMVTFGIGFGVHGNVTPKTAFAAIATKTAIPWQAPSSSDKAKIDDLLHASVNSRGGFFSADKPDEFAKGLTNTLNAINERVGSASNLAAVSTSTEAGAQVFQGRYVSGKWSGDLWAYDITDGATVKWKASEKLPGYTERNIKFIKDGKLTDFKADKVSKSEIAVANDGIKTAIVNYIRGDKSNEASENATYSFRNRTSILGDIVNSAPAYVGAPERMGYQRYTHWPEASKYEKFLSENNGRQPMVYVGANDGMLHAFNANTGEETFAYIPQAVIPQLHKLADVNYAHQYFVDGNTTVRDIYLNDSWRTVLLATTGRGNFSSLFALDITNPESITVLFDIAVDAIGQNIGKPIVARSNDSSWTAILGSGFNNSANETGLLYFKLGDLIGEFGNYSGAAAKLLKVDNTSNNGFGQIESWDYDFDGNMDFVYSGDLKGQIWKFDLRGSGGWKVGNSAQPLFKAETDGTLQPITGGLTLSTEPHTGKLWIHFGTGKYLTLADLDSAKFKTQSIYGITDDFSDSGATFKRSDLVVRVLTADSADPTKRGLSESTILDPGKRGWYIDLASGERVVLPGILADQKLEIVTITPDNDPCLAGGTSWKLAIDPYKGGRLKTNYFDTNNDGNFDENDNLSNGEVTSGVLTDGILSGRTIIRTGADGEPYVGIDSDSAGKIGGPEALNIGIRSNRLTWRELQ